MSIENPERLERLERTEEYLKQRLSDYKEIMPVKGGNGVTLLEIYGEWIKYLVKENLKKKSDLLEKWRRFLLERHTDAIADLLIGFFEAKRRYGRDKGRGEDRWDWFSLCKNYCKKFGWHNDEDLLYSLFSSYSGAERRIYHKVKEGKVLEDASRSLLQVMDLTKAEMIQKEEDKRRKAEEKQKKAEERLKKAEEKRQRAEEKKKEKEKKEERRTKKKVSKLNHDVKNSDTYVIESPNGDEEDKEVDPDYPKAPEGWRDPVDLNIKGPYFGLDGEGGSDGDWRSKAKNSKGKGLKRDKDQGLIKFPDDE